jgi:hypothetical protein
MFFDRLFSCDLSIYVEIQGNLFPALRVDVSAEHLYSGARKRFYDVITRCQYLTAVLVCRLVLDELLLSLNRFQGCINLYYEYINMRCRFLHRMPTAPGIKYGD